MQKNPSNFSIPSAAEIGVYTFVVTHGVDGYPDKSWYPSIEKQLKLRELGHEVIVLQLPTELPKEGVALYYPNGGVPEELKSYKYQRHEIWNARIHEATEGKDHSRIVHIGHSLGGAEVAQEVKQAGEEGKPYFAAIYVAPVGADIRIKALRPGLKSFYMGLTGKENGEKIHGGSRKNIFIVSDNDRIVRAWDSLKVAADCRADEIVIVKNGGHLNADSGFTQFPLLLDKIAEVMSEAPRLPTTGKTIKRAKAHTP